MSKAKDAIKAVRAIQKAARRVMAAQDIRESDTYHELQAAYSEACNVRDDWCAQFTKARNERDALRASEARVMEVLEPRALVRRFHEAYERFAPTFGYLTRPETRKLDVDSPNGLLMLAVCEEIFRAAFAHAPDRTASPTPEQQSEKP